MRGSHVIYERNPHYWDGDKPYIDRLIVRFIPDAAARTAAIESGQVQIAPSSPVPFSEVDRLRTKPALSFETRVMNTSTPSIVWSSTWSTRP